MAWVSPKVYAILNNSEEGKDIIEKLPDMSQDECQQALDDFFGEGGKGASKGNEYNQAKFDDEAEEERYKAIGDEEVSEKDYEDNKAGSLLDEVEDAEDDEEKAKLEDKIRTALADGEITEKEEKMLLDKLYGEEDEITDDDISEALADYQWQITNNTTVGQYAQETADKLGCSKEQVLKVIRNEDPNISEDEKMAKIAGLDDGEDNVVGLDDKNATEKVEGKKKKLDDLVKERSTMSKDKNYDAYSFKKELEENGYEVDYVENRSGTWQDHNGEKFKEYDIKLSDGQHIYFKLIADENYDTKEMIIYKNGKNW